MAARPDRAVLRRQRTMRPSSPSAWGASMRTLPRESGDAELQSELTPFVPALLRTWLTEGTAAPDRVVRGTLVMIDISGFTQLTERLATRGRVGAEELTEILNATFS